ncbi:MAG: hypothetical protein WAU68_12600 [Vitreimonas sp.]
MSFLAYAFGGRDILATPVSAADVERIGVSTQCTSNDWQRIHTWSRAGEADFDVAYASNAEEVRHGRSDSSFDGSVELDWISNSRVGLCQHHDGDEPSFDPNWTLTTSLTVEASDYFQDIGGDSGDAQLGFNYSHRIGDGVTDNHTFQTHVSLGLANTIAYDGFFEDWSFSSHNLSLAVDHDFVARESGGISANVTLGTVWVNPDDASYSYAQAGITGTIKDIGLGVGLEIDVTAAYRRYASVHPEREDHIYALDVIFSHAITENAELQLDLGFKQRDSSLSADDFHSYNVPFTLVLKHSF